MADIHHFTTESLPVGDRYEAWRNRGWPSLAPVLESDAPGVPFDAVIDTLDLGGCR